MTRDAASLRFELEYWGAIVPELSAIHDGIGEVAERLTSVTLGVAATALQTDEDARQASTLNVMTSTREALGELLTMQRRLNALGDLLDGRLMALSVEASELTGEES